MTLVLVPKKGEKWGSWEKKKRLRIWDLPEVWLKIKITRGGGGLQNSSIQEKKKTNREQVSSPELSTDQTGWVNKVRTGSSSNGWLN